MAPRSFWSALPLFLLLTPALAVENDFSFYPSGARSCLYDSADSAGCTSGSISALNTCLCGNNNNFVINTAKCLGEKDSGDVDTVYDTMSSACSTSNTPLSVSKSDFQDAASGASSGTTTAADSSSTDAASSTQAASSASTDSATTTASESVVTQSAYTTTVAGGSTITVIPTQTHTSAGDSGSSSSSSSSSGLSTTATIGVGVGAAVAGAGLVGAIVFFVLRRRRRRDEEQGHPMLLQNQQGTPQNPSPFAPPPSATPAMTFSDAQSQSQSHSNWTGGTSPSPASAGWGKPDGVSPQYSQYNTPGQVHLAPGAVPPMQQVYEMDSSQTVIPPVEMPGSAMQR